MTWSYSGDPSSSLIDEKRFELSDTNADEPIMQNEEIEYLINKYGHNDSLLMYHLFIRAATLFARDIKRRLGPQSEDPTERMKFFEKQARKYENKFTVAGLSVPVYAHAKIFNIGMQNNPPHSVKG